jgi:cytoplasmic iron level regulating protein YaaA (DUF328/UPF0246 family)
MILTFIPAQSKADTSPAPVTATKTVESTDISVLIARVEKINAMDRSALSSSEKKELRKELRTIKSDLKKSSKSDSNAGMVNNGGVYLSVGAIIVVILLLVLLL